MFSSAMSRRKKGAVVQSATTASVLRDFGQAAGEEAAFGFRLRELECAPICRGGLVDAFQSAEQIGARRVVQVVLVEWQVVHQREAVFRSLGHGDGDGAVEVDNRRRGLSVELPVARGDLGPVRLR